MFNEVNFYLIFYLFLLLLIGMGPRMALVPFLELTRGLETDTQRKVADTMVRMAVGMALLLAILGWLLMRLLHLTPGVANVAGGIILLLLALHMLVSPTKKDHHEKAKNRGPQEMVIYPLAVPYLLNTVGIASLIIASSAIDAILSAAILVGLVLLIGFIDFAVFRNMDKLSKYLDPLRLVVIKVLFGVLLATLAVMLMAYGLAEMGVIEFL